jgi:tetratricopeptide (TPR) repeat protein
MRRAAEAGEGRAMSNLALLLLEDKQPAEALDWAAKGVAATPMHGPAYMTYGKVALAAGKAEVAYDAFMRAFELAPNDCNNRYNLALAELETKRFAASREHVTSCTSDPKLAARSRALLDEIARRH